MRLYSDVMGITITCLFNNKINIYMKVYCAMNPIRVSYRFYFLLAKQITVGDWIELDQRNCYNMRSVNWFMSLNFYIIDAMISNVFSRITYYNFSIKESELESSVNLWKSTCRVSQGKVDLPLYLEKWEFFRKFSKQPKFDFEGK